MTKRSVLAATLALLLPAATLAAQPVIAWRDCMRLAPKAVVRPTPVEPDANDGGPFHAQGPTNVQAVQRALGIQSRPRQWINAYQHAEVYTDASGILRYDPATVAGNCPTGTCPR